MPPIIKEKVNASKVPFADDQNDQNKTLTQKMPPMIKEKVNASKVPFADDQNKVPGCHNLRAHPRQPKQSSRTPRRNEVKSPDSCMAGQPVKARTGITDPHPGL